MIGLQRMKMARSTSSLLRMLRFLDVKSALDSEMTSYIREEVYIGAFVVRRTS